MHRNVLRDPQILLDAEKKVQRPVSQRAFCRIRTRPTQAVKIVHRRFVTRTHGNALRET
jgi:hypothetical protein